MDYTSITFGLDVLVSVVFGAGGAMGVYFTMKGRIDLIEKDLTNFMANSATEISNLKHEQQLVRQEFDRLSDKVDANQQASDKAIADLKEFIMQMKIDIIQEIHAKK